MTAAELREALAKVPSDAVILTGEGRLVEGIEGKRLIVKSEPKPVKTKKVKTNDPGSV
jgi:hypothetical protein